MGVAFLREHGKYLFSFDNVMFSNDLKIIIIRPLRDAIHNFIQI